MENILTDFLALNPTYRFTKIYALGILAILLFEHKRRLSYVQSPFIKLWDVIILGFNVKNINPVYFNLLFATLCGSLICVIFLIAPRLMLIISSLLAYIYMRITLYMDDVNRKPFHVITILLSLAFLPEWGKENVATTSYLVILISVILSQMYFSTSYQKLKKSGLKWMNGHTMRSNLFYHYLLYNNKLAFWLGKQSTTILIFLSIYALLFELSFILVLGFPNLLIYYICAGILFHLGILLFMKINYFRLIIWSYLALAICLL